MLGGNFTGDCPDFRGTSGVAMRKCLTAAKMGLSPWLREGDRSMFSVNRLSAKCVFSPKNGPVPNRGVNGYP